VQSHQAQAVLNAPGVLGALLQMGQEGGELAERVQLEMRLQAALQGRVAGGHRIAGDGA